MIYAIAAIGSNRELGKDNKLLWDIPADLQFFRSTTKNHPIIMGRKTFESIGRVLPNRTNIIVTRNVHFKAEGCVVKNNLEDAVSYAKTVDKDVYVIGGAQIYKAALPLVDILYLTLVDTTFQEADTFFPRFSHMFKKIEENTRKNESFTYAFTTWTKK